MSSSEDEKSDYIPFKDRPEWNDVEPVLQDDGPEPVCQIAYTPEYVDIMNYMRAILQKNEHSERALRLTTEVLEYNAANYTIWTFRRSVLQTLKSDLRKELEYVGHIGKENEKNYQIWYHRRYLVEKLQDPSFEMDYTAEQIKNDSKNYHAWAHRQWVIETFNYWDKELEFVNSCIEIDLRNNSAWNQRYFVLTRKGTVPLSQETIDSEVKYTLNLIQKSPNNESPWAYLRGLFKGKGYSCCPSLKSTLLEFRPRFPVCAHVASLLVDIYEEQKNFSEASILIEELETKLDTFHNKYWEYRKKKLQSN